jgi:hypothetical protein
VLPSCPWLKHYLKLRSLPEQEGAEGYTGRCPYLRAPTRRRWRSAPPAPPVRQIADGKELTGQVNFCGARRTSAKEFLPIR